MPANFPLSGRELFKDVVDPTADIGTITKVDIAKMGLYGIVLPAGLALGAALAFKTISESLPTLPPEDPAALEESIRENKCIQNPMGHGVPLCGL